MNQMKHGNTSIRAEIANRAIGRRLKETREQMGISQGALAKPLGVTFQQVQKYEKGRNRITAATLVVMLENLGVSAVDFFEHLDWTKDPLETDKKQSEEQLAFLFT